MKNKEKENFTKLSRTGISLIVLIITIIVIIIISAVIVMTISRNNPLSSANEAIFKEDISNFKTELEIYKAEMKYRGENPEKLNANRETTPHIQEVITSMTNKYAKILEVINGELVYVGNNKTEYSLAYEMGMLPKSELLNDEIMEELQPFITEWTVNAGDSITLPVGGSCNFTVDYGDESETLKVTNSTDEDITHTYEKSGNYTVTTTGKCTSFSMSNCENKDKLTKLVQWGSTGFTSINFSNCTNLTGEIPEPSKNSLKNVEEISSLFMGCSNLTGSIPENLFANCSKVTDFNNTFYGCSNLTGSIPENLFANCSKVTGFSNTFNGCSNLIGSIPENLFTNCSEVISFASTFASCENLTGDALPLWERENVTEYNNCFYKCTNLSNYADIPDGWK